MATQTNSSNQDFTNSADGFILGGGATERKLTVTGGNVTVTGSGSNTYTMPASTDTLVGRASTDTLTNKTIVASSNTISGIGTVRLNTVETTDFISGTSLTANTWTDFRGNQNFTVGSTSSIIQISFSTAMFIGNNAATNVSRLVIDSAGSAQYVKLGGSAYIAGYTNAFAGAGVTTLTGLSPGVHTLKTQVLSTAANQAYCRASTNPNFEFYSTTVIEING